MGINRYILVLLVALVVNIFSGCSSSSSENTTEDLNTKTYIINETQNKDIPITAQFKSASTDQAEVKLTRDVEQEIVNVYVIKGSVEVTEAISQ